jgi:uncharacterized OB-fold protein
MSRDPDMAGRFLEPALVVGGNDEHGRPHPGQPIQLAASHCASCRRTAFPALATCPECGAPSTSIGLPTEGRVHAHTSVLAPPPDAEIEPPYHIGLVTFEDQHITVMGLLTSEPAGPGAKTTTVAHPVGGGFTFAFQPVEA